MDQNPSNAADKKAKSPSKLVGYGAIRVCKEVRKRFTAELEKLNEKGLGRDVRGDELLAHLLMLLDDNGRRALQEATMSQEDLIERDYLEYCARHEKITKDEYYGKLRRGEVVAEPGTVDNQEVRG